MADLVSGERKRDNQRHDFLSDLPLSIIHSILEFVPIRDAVRTCILSKQWRYIWTSLPTLVFDNEFFNRKDTETPIVECKHLEDFITNALSLHQGPIHSFRLSISHQRFCPKVESWLLCLSRNEISELFLQTRDYKPVLFSVHSDLYSCRKLTHLKLSQCTLPQPPPSFQGFSCLRSLVLHSVEVSSDALECVVSNSPLLESFEFCFSKNSELRITAPNLKFLRLLGHFKELSVYAPVVAQVSIEVFRSSFRSKQLQQKYPVCNFTKFLGGFTNLARLKGREGFTKYLSIGIGFHHHPLVFHKLTHIKLYHLRSRHIREISVLVHLIMNAPNLYKLCTSFLNELGAPRVSFSDFRCTPNFSFEKLKVVKMKLFSGAHYELEFVEYVLRSSPVLETMRLRSSHIILNTIANLKIELRSYGKASPNCKIFLK